MMIRKSESRQSLLILAGPTAAGKTKIAILLAKKLNTEIISADSASVYRYIDLGTAKPTQKEQELVKHHLIDVVEPHEDFSVADYQKLAIRAIKDLAGDGKLPLLAGGTGLYINAVTENYAFGDHGANPALRQELWQRAKNEGGNDYLYNRLLAVDPTSAAIIHPHDLKRTIRALEFYETEGIPISQQVEATNLNPNPYNTLFFGITMDRNRLYERIEQRVDNMINEGFIAEVKSLLSMGYKEQDPGLQVLGYRQLTAYLNGKVDLAEAIASIKKETRNLAKRQLTWFRRNKNIRWFNVTDEKSIAKIVENIYTAVKELPA